MFGISRNVRSREVQICTPELFHQATQSAKVKDVCAQIEDALERKRRGEICQADYDTMKTQLKSQLPILTPHATFRNGRRLNADAIPSGLSIYDKDHIPDPRGYWKVKSEEVRVKNPTVLERILLVHVTPSLEGLRLVFTIPEGMSLAEAQHWMSEQLEDAEYDSCVKDLARPSFIVPEDYILYINEAELFKDRSFSHTDSTGNIKHTDLTDFTDSAGNMKSPTDNTDLHRSECFARDNTDSASQTNNTQNTINNENNDKTTRPAGDSGAPAAALGAPAEHAQPSDSHDSPNTHLSNHGSNQSCGASPSVRSVRSVCDSSNGASQEIHDNSCSKTNSVISVISVGDSSNGASPSVRSVRSVCDSSNGASQEIHDNSCSKTNSVISVISVGDSSNGASPSVRSVRSVCDSFPSDYDGIAYSDIVNKLVELLGGEPEHGSRNSFIFSLACYLRYLCDDNREWIKTVIPTFGEEQQRAFTTVDSACNRKQASRMPAIVRKAIKLCQDEQARGRATDYDAEDFGDINNPESYFYRIHQMPERLPRLIRLLVSRTPAIYQPAVSQAVFPALGAHLCDTRFRYIDNVEHEATLMNILCAPTGSGKESITQPINRIMTDIRQRDAEQRERERLWKDECNRKGSNKDKRERPEGLVIQEVNIDMTNPAFVLRMKEAENHFLYAKVNELNLFDALKGKTNQHFRIMELAFDLGNYGQDRVGIQSVTETVKVRFNWNACCTPKKCRDYFRRVVTDGPVSRISFATIERRPCGSAMPVYGTYDASFDEELKPYIDNLVKARGLVDCPQAVRLARKLVEENAEFARLSQNYVFENLSFRANVIAYLKACVLYVANGMKWEKAIEDFVRWSERYDLWCKLKLFGQMIYDADEEQEKVSRTAQGGPTNLLTLLPDEFTMADYIKVRRAQGFDNDNRTRIKMALNQWVHRGYVVKQIAEGTSDDNDNDSAIFRKLKFLNNKLWK